MCGIAGLIDLRRETSEAQLRAIANAMGTALRHRGPDDDGIWVDAAAGVALAHRRLSIIDLSELGHQPMVSADERYRITYNGEVYNYLDLRKQLEQLGHAFRGRSDTEVLLTAFVEWGVHDALRRANGMFALAVWDDREHELHLALDRFGEKPLYFGHFDGLFLFASELKAFWEHPDFMARIDHEALAVFTRHAYVAAPRSIFRGVSKLEPGMHLVFAPSRRSTPTIEPYWSAQAVALDGLADPLELDEVSACDELELRLRDAIGMRLVSDVPLGATLSGGIDSSTVVALMQAQGSVPVKTFTIGYEVAGYNEAPYARAVAHHLGTDHTELSVTPEEAQAVIPRLASIYDEPFADSSQIPTFLVSQLAREQVTVALSGEGGDELFGGYPRYRHALRLERLLGRVPPSLERRVSESKRPGTRLERMAMLLEQRHPVDRYVSLMSYWDDGDGLLREPARTEAPLRVLMRSLSDDLTAEQMMLADTLTYLPGDNLTKVDRASMAVSLEVRAPMLDPAVFEFAWRLPLSMRLGSHQDKVLLRRVLDRYVPAPLVDRPKRGFAAPIDHWLRGPLRDWASELLAPSTLEADGFFDAAVVAARWREHLDGQHAWHYHLWPLLMFGAWLREQPRRPAHA